MTSGPTPPSPPAAGWYPDPLGPGSERLWDGGQWSEQTRPASTESIPPSLELRQTQAPDPQRPTSSKPTRDRSGSGFSTGSVVGIGCGLLALLSLGGCVVLVGVVPLMAVRSEGAFVEEATEVAVAIPETTAMAVPAPMEPMEEFPPTTAGPGVARYGSSVEMVGVLAGGDGAGFEVAVEEPVDLTEAILAAGGPELEPGDDRVVVGFAATMMLRESLTEVVAAPGIFSWTFVGEATGTLHQPVAADVVGCDLVDDDLTAVDEFVIGEEQRGVICFLVAAEDLEAPGSQLLLETFGGAPITWTR